MFLNGWSLNLCPFKLKILFINKLYRNFMKLILNDPMTTELFGHSRRCFIGAAIQSAANVASTAMSNEVTERVARETNLTNERIQNSVNDTNIRLADQANALQKSLADEANALNYKMFTEQNDFNLNMWEKNNEYNSPSAQMKRLVEAGINPNLLGSNGSNPTGISNEMPSSAQYAGAQMADVNPARIDSVKHDAYSLLPFNLDYLEPASIAAGINKTNAEADATKLSNEFDASTFNTRAEAETGRLKFLISQVNALDEQTSFNKSSRKMQLLKMDYANRLNEATLKSLNQEFEKRAEEFKEWKQMSKVRKETAISNLQKIVHEIKSLSSDVVHQRALEKHWANQDDISSQNIELYRKGLLFEKLRTAKDLYMMTPVARDNIAAAIADDDNGLSKFIDSLDGAAEGNWSTWLSAVLHSESGSKLERLLDALVSKYVPETVE